MGVGSAPQASKSSKLLVVVAVLAVLWALGSYMQAREYEEWRRDMSTSTTTTSPPTTEFEPSAAERAEYANFCRAVDYYGVNGAYVRAQERNPGLDRSAFIRRADKYC